MILAYYTVITEIRSAPLLCNPPFPLDQVQFNESKAHSQRGAECSTPDRLGQFIEDNAA